MSFETVGLKGVFEGANVYIHQVNVAAAATTKLGAAAQHAGGQAQHGSMGFGKLASAMAVGQIAAQAATAIAGLGMAAVKTGFGFNQLQQNSLMAFESMLGSADKAKAFMNELTEFAKYTPFETGPLVKQAQQLLNMGFAAKEVIPTLTAIGDAVSRMGGGTESIERVTRAITQMKSKGKVSAEEMMQLAEAGIPAWQILAEGMGKTMGEIQEMGQKGLLRADKSIAILIAGMEKRNAGAMEQGAKTFQGRVSTLKDQLTQLSAIATKPLYDMAIAGMAKISSVLDDPRFIAGATAAAEAIGSAVSAAGEMIVSGLGVAIDWIRGTAIPAIQDMWSSLASTPEMQKFVGLMNQTQTAVAGIDWGNTFSGLVDALQPAIEFLTPFVEKVLVDLRQGLNDIGKAFGNLGTALAPLAPLFEPLAKALGTVVVASIAFRLVLLDLQIQLTSTLIAGAINAIAGAINLGVAAFNAIKGAIEGVVGWFRKHETATKSLVLALSPLIIAVGLALAPFVLLGKGIQQVIKHFDDIMDAVGAAADFIGGALGDLAGAVVDYFVDIVRPFLEFPGEVNDALSGVPGDMLQIGIDIVQGLWDGISDRWGSFIDWLWDKADDIPGVLKKFLGIHSPSEVMAEIGESIPEGLELGIDREGYRVGAAMDRLGDIAVLSAANTVDRIEYTMAGLGDLVSGYGIQAEDFTGIINPWAELATAETMTEWEKSLKLSSDSASPAKGGGKGGGSAKDVADALETFLGNVASELASRDLTAKFGEAGAAVMTAFGEAITKNDASAGNALYKTVQEAIDTAKELGVPNAEEFGASLMQAVADGLGSKDSSGIASLLTQLSGMAELTADSFSASFGKAMKSAKRESDIGSAGIQFMATFTEALEKGGSKAILAVGNTAADITLKLKDKLKPEQAEYVGNEFMNALRTAIDTKSPESIAALEAMMGKINELMNGAAIDIRDGTVIAADAIEDLAKKLGVSADWIVENLNAIVDSGILSVVGKLDKIPAATAAALDHLAKLYADGVISARAYADAVVKELNRIAGATSGASSGLGKKVTIPGVAGGAGGPNAGSGVDLGTGLQFGNTYRYVAIGGGMKAMVAPDGTVMNNSAVPIDPVYYDNAGNYQANPDKDHPNQAPNPTTIGMFPTDSRITGNHFNSYGLGTNLVPYDMLAFIHKDEAIIPAAVNRAFLAMSSGASGGSATPNGPTVTIDMRGAQMTGTPAENEAMMRRVVSDALDDAVGRDAYLHGVR